jgi:hypothetical protein
MQHILPPEDRLGGDIQPHRRYDVGASGREFPIEILR